MACAAGGQWFRLSCQLKRDAARVPSWPSLAAPEKLIVWPTCQVVPAAGELIVATGGVLPALIVTEAVEVAPASSVTRRLTL